MTADESNDDEIRERAAIMVEHLDPDIAQAEYERIVAEKKLQKSENNS